MAGFQSHVLTHWSLVEGPIEANLIKVTLELLFDQQAEMQSGPSCAGHGPRLQRAATQRPRAEDTLTSHLGQAEPCDPSIHNLFQIADFDSSVIRWVRRPGDPLPAQGSRAIKNLSMQSVFKCVSNALRKHEENFRRTILGRIHYSKPESCSDLLIQSHVL